jgi:hypothetical protein
VSAQTASVAGVLEEGSDHLGVGVTELDEEAWMRA